MGRKRRNREENEEPEINESTKEPEKPFGGILTKEDADTSKTTPTEIDRARFDRARESAMVLVSLRCVNGSLKRNLVLQLLDLPLKFHQVRVVIPSLKQHLKSAL
jgi:hypothetical protein